MSKLGSRQIAALAACSLFITGAVACSGSPAPSGPTTDSEDKVTDPQEEDGLQILFSPMYSAFDGQHTFKIPAKVDGVKKVTWTASDPSMVDLDPNGATVMITVRKAGTVTIKAKSGELVGTSKLTITSSSADVWEAGNERYNNGIVLKRGSRDGGARDGGRGDGGAWSEEARQAACTNCHGTGGSGNDVEHTPMQTGGYSDDQLIDIFTKGVKPDGVPQRIMPLEQWHRIHQWSMNDDAKQGLVIYLRSLEPKSQGPVDFGGGWGGHHRDGGGT